MGWNSKLKYVTLTVLCLGLNGCIFTPYQIASWTVTGISYLFTGKGMSDHALSVAMKKDCAVHRIVVEGRVCLLDVKRNPDGLTAVALLRGDFENSKGIATVGDPVTLPMQMGDLVGVLGGAAKRATELDALAVLP